MQNTQRIFKRALIFAKIADAGAAFSLTGSVSAGALRNWPSFAATYGLETELTAHEGHIIEHIRAGDGNRHGIEASWYCEGLAMCLWILGLGEPPAISSDVAPLPIIRRMLHPVPHLEVLRVQSAETCRRALHQWFWVHRRIHAFIHGLSRCDLACWINHTPGFNQVQEDLPLLEGDLALDDEPLFEYDIERLPYGTEYTYVTGWRLRVLKWVCGLVDDFPDATACPHGLQQVDACTKAHTYGHEKPGSGDELDGHGGRAAHHAAYHGNVGDLKVNAAFCGLVDIDGDQALHCAIAGGQLEAVRQLLELGADPNASDGCGQLPLSIAINRGDIELFNVLVSGCACLDGSPGRLPPIFDAIAQTPPTMLERMLAAGASTEVLSDVGQTPLIVALMEDYPASAEALIKAGANVFALDPRRQSTLHWAACRGNVAHVQQLVSLGVPLHAQSETGMTPLALALANGFPSCANALLDLGAAPDAVSANGRSILLLATGGGDLEVVKRLLDMGVVLEAPEQSGTTILNAALLSQKEGVFEVLVEAGANIHAADAQGMQPIHVAANVGHLNAIKQLVHLGADVNAASPAGLTPLMAACLGYGESCIGYLVQEGADPDRADTHGRTALHYATESAEELVLAMLEVGANPTKVDLAGRTPFDDPHRGLVQAGLRALARSDDRPIETRLWALHGLDASSLKAIAKAEGIKGVSKLGKAKLREKVTAHWRRSMA
jgi:ankyrin repeat protein